MKKSISNSNFDGKLTIIIPAFNEEVSIGNVVKKIKALDFDFLEEIIVVDDGSCDKTAEMSNEAGARVISHNANFGYGKSIKTGIRSARTEYILTFDADGQHHPEDILRLWELADVNDMIVGQRTKLIHSAWWRMPGKWLLGTMANYLTRQKIPDINSGLRLVRRDVVQKYLHLCPNGFSFSTTITMTFFNRGYRVTYRPVDILERKRGKSEVSISTGLETIILVLRLAVLFNPLRVFFPISSFIGGLGLLWGIPYALKGAGISIGSMLAIITAILLFGLGLLSDQIAQLRLERFE